jgi:hypothetical protein
MGSAEKRPLIFVFSEKTAYLATVLGSMKNKQQHRLLFIRFDRKKQIIHGLHILLRRRSKL